VKYRVKIKIWPRFFVVGIFLEEKASRTLGQIVETKVKSNDMSRYSSVLINFLWGKFVLQSIISPSKISLIEEGEAFKRCIRKENGEMMGRARQIMLEIVESSREKI